MRQLKNVVVVGAGVAGTRAAEALRQDGYDGDLTIVGAERHAPVGTVQIRSIIAAFPAKRSESTLMPQPILHPQDQP